MIATVFIYFAQFSGNAADFDNKQPTMHFFSTMKNKTKPQLQYLHLVICHGRYLFHFKLVKQIVCVHRIFLF